MNSETIAIYLYNAARQLEGAGDPDRYTIKEYIDVKKTISKLHALALRLKNEGLPDDE
jgi:hypothetical protein